MKSFGSRAIWLAALLACMPIGAAERAVTVAAPCESPGADLLVSPVIGPVLKATRCQVPYDPRLWPQAVSTENPLTESDARVWLAKFSKPGGFSTFADQRVLESLLRDGYARTHAEEVRAALRGVAAVSDELALDYAKNFPETMNSPAKAIPAMCTTEAERRQLREKIDSAVRKRVGRGELFAIYKLKLNAPLARLVYSRDELEDLADYAGTAAAAQSLHYAQIDSKEKVQALSRASARIRLGLDQAPIQDIVLRRATGAISPQIVSTEPIESTLPFLQKFARDEGMGAELRGPIQIDPKERQPVTRTEEWGSGGRRYRALIEVKPVGTSKSVLPTGGAPDYRLLWRDKRFLTLVVIGSNVENKLADKTAKGYLDYYRAAGFRFAAPRELVDIDGFVRERIRGREQAQFMIKEAHSDGDDMHLLSIAVGSTLIRGERSAGDKTEVVELIVPLAEGAGTVNVANGSFGDWMRERERAGGKPLIYLNSSCWSSLAKAPAEISAAATPLLIDIPFTTEADSFQNKRGNIMRAIVDGIRNRKSYAQIREAMRADPEYRAGTDNQAILPDERRYASTIAPSVVPVTTEVKLFERVNETDEWKPYSPVYPE